MPQGRSKPRASTWGPRPWTTCGNPPAGYYATSTVAHFLSTQLYSDYDDAVADAQQANDVLVLPLVIRSLTV